MAPPTTGCVTPETRPCCSMRPAGMARASVLSRHWLISKPARHSSSAILDIANLICKRGSMPEIWHLWPLVVGLWVWFHNAVLIMLHLRVSAAISIVHSNPLIIDHGQ